MTATFSPPKLPSANSSVAWTARLIESQFGDGYAQTTPDGTNALEGSVTATWNALEIAEADAIEAFFRANVGQPFYWAAPRRGLSVWECKTWSRSNVGGRIDRITATITLRPDGL